MSARNWAYLAANIEAAKQRCPWWVPVYRAVRQGIRFSVTTPSLTALGMPGDTGKGEVFHVGDDLIETVGPSAFPLIARAMIQQRIEAAGHIILVAGAPLTRFYQEAADTALAGKNVVLIEARRQTRMEWADFIRAHARPDAVVTGVSCK